MAATHQAWFGSKITTCGCVCFLYARFANLEKPLIRKRQNGVAATSTETEKRHLQIALEYLHSIEQQQLSAEQWRDITLKIALCHYYHGSLKNARIYLLRLIAHNPLEMLPWR